MFVQSFGLSKLQIWKDEDDDDDDDDDNNNGDHDHENDEDGDAMTTHFSCNRYMSLMFRVAIPDVPASNLAPEVCTEKPKVANMHTRP